MRPIYACLFGYIDTQGIMPQSVWPASDCGCNSQSKGAPFLEWPHSGMLFRGKRLRPEADPEWVQGVHSNLPRF